MASKLKTQEVILQSPNGLVEKTLSIDDSGVTSFPQKSTEPGTLVNYIWSGTQAQYDAIGTKDANTLYFIV